MRTVITTLLLAMCLQAADPVKLRFAAGGPDAVDGTGDTWKGIPCPVNSAKLAVASVAAIDQQKPAYSNLCYTQSYMDFPASNLENGVYLVRLHFIEPNNIGSGVRTEDIYINGQLVHHNLDVSSLSGGWMKLWSTGYMVYVTEGQLNIRVTNTSPTLATRRSAIISGIQIDQFSGGSWTTTAVPLPAVAERQICKSGLVLAGPLGPGVPNAALWPGLKKISDDVTQATTTNTFGYSAYSCDGLEMYRFKLADGSIIGPYVAVRMSDDFSPDPTLWVKQ